MKKVTKKLMSGALIIFMLLMVVGNSVVFAASNEFEVSAVNYDEGNMWIDFPSNITLDITEISPSDVSVIEVNGGTVIPLALTTVGERSFWFAGDFAGKFKGGEQYAIVFTNNLTANGNTMKLKENAIYFTGKNDYENILFETSFTEAGNYKQLAASSSSITYDNFGRNCADDDYAAKVAPASDIAGGAAVTVQSLPAVDDNNDILNYSLDIYKNNLSSNTWIDFQGSGHEVCVRLDTQGNMVFRRYVDWFGNLQDVGTADYETNYYSKALTAKTWYNLKFQFNKATGKVAFFVDGQKVSDSISTFTTETVKNFPNAFVVVTEGPATVAEDWLGIDNIKVSQPTKTVAYTRTKIENFDDGASDFNVCSPNTSQSAIEYSDIAGHGKALAIKYIGLTEVGNDIYSYIEGLKPYLTGTKNVISFDIMMPDGLRVTSSPMAGVGDDGAMASLLDAGDCIYPLNKNTPAAGNSAPTAFMNCSRYDHMVWHEAICPAFKTGQWYNIKYVLDTTTNYVTTYVNDIYLAKQDIHLQNVANMDKLFFRQYYNVPAGETRYFYIDNLETGRLDEQVKVSSSKLCNDGVVALSFDGNVDLTTVTNQTLKIYKDQEAVNYTLGSNNTATNITLQISNFLGSYDDYSIELNGVKATTGAPVKDYDAKFYSFGKNGGLSNVTSLTFTNASDESIVNFANGGSAYINASITNNNYTPTDVVVAYACYDANNKCIDVNSKTFNSVAPGASVQTSNKELGYAAVPSGAKTIKVFVFEGWDKLRPVCSASKILVAE